MLCTWINGSVRAVAVMNFRRTERGGLAENGSSLEFVIFEIRRGEMTQLVNPRGNSFTGIAGNDS